VKVLDFGLAKAFETANRPADVGAPTISVTAAQTVLGTPAYMSPEQSYFTLPAIVNGGVTSKLSTTHTSDREE
jgi:serine/threonine protein kinase